MYLIGASVLLVCCMLTIYGCLLQPKFFRFRSPAAMRQAVRINIKRTWSEVEGLPFFILMKRVCL